MFTLKSKFDFKVIIDNHVVAVEQGKQISIPVRIQKVRGKPRLVTLSVNTRWDSVGLTAKLTHSAFTPDSEWTTTMMIRASGSTPPDSYLFIVRGETEGTFNTSEDAVTVIVKPKDKQKPDEEDNSQSEQFSGATEPTHSLDNLFAPSSDTPTFAKGVHEKLSPDKSEKIKKHSSAGSVIGVIVGIIIVIIVLSATGVFKDLSKGGTCPASAPIDCGGGCCPAGDGGRADVCCPGNKCTRNGKCGSTIPIKTGCPKLSGCGTVAPQCECPSDCPKYFIVTNPPSLNGYKQCHN